MTLGFLGRSAPPPSASTIGQGTSAATIINDYVSERRHWPRATFVPPHPPGLAQYDFEDV